MRLHPGIIAGAGAPVIGNPGDFTLDTAKMIGGYKTVTIPFGPAGAPETAGFPANTLIGTVSGIAAGGLSSLQFAPGGDGDGNFKLVGNALYSNARLNFEDKVIPALSSAVYGSAGRRAYYVTLQGLGPSGVPLNVQFRIRPRFPIIRPTGGTDAPWDGRPTLPPPVPPATDRTDIHKYGNWKNFISAVSDGKQMRIHPSVIGTTAPGGQNGGPFFPGGSNAKVDNVTIMGHNRISVDRGGGWKFEAGNNHLIKHVAFRAGGDLDGYDFSDRDSAHVGSATNVIFENCTFSWSIDELVSLIGRERNPRHVRFSRCIFHLPLITAGHAKGSHSFGPLAVRTMNAVFDKCVFIGLNQRSPQFGYCNGAVVQNCIVGRFGANNQNGGTNAGVIARYAGVDPNQEAYECTSIVRANLYQDFLPASTNQGSRRYAITIQNLNGQGQFGSKIYIPQGTNHDNHFFKLDATMGGVPNLSNDPLNRTDNIGTISSPYNSTGCIVDYPPFETDMDSELMPTATDAQRRALWDNVYNNAGPHFDGVNETNGLTGMPYIEWENLTHFLATGTTRNEFGQFPNGPTKPPVPSAATYDWSKCSMLPPGAPPWPVAIAGATAATQSVQTTTVSTQTTPPPPAATSTSTTGSGIFDSTTLALIAAMSFPPDGQRATLYDNFIRALKDAGVWTKLDLLYLMAAHDTQAARLNLKSPGTFDLQPIGAPTFTPNRGFQGNGSSDALDTTWDPVNNPGNFTQSSGMLAFGSNTSGQGTAIDCGGGFGTWILARNTADQYNLRIAAGNTITPPNADGSGRFVSQRSGNQLQAFKNNALLGTGSLSSIALEPADFRFLGHSGNPPFSTREQWFGAVGSALTPAELTAFDTALATWKAVVGF